MNEAIQPDSVPAPGPPFEAHLTTIAQRWEAALATTGFDAAVVTAGTPRPYFLDDQTPPYRLNPHFLQWCPSPEPVGSVLLIRPGQSPRFYFLREEDYWHLPPELPRWAERFDVVVCTDPQSLGRTLSEDLRATGNHIALVGESSPDGVTGWTEEQRNPVSLLNRLHFDRAVKTEFELDCMRAANRRAARGHRAAREAFGAKESEFGIHLAYLAASQQLPDELPYASIVALNEHAGTLHYQHYQRRAPEVFRSFLIDAGGAVHAYAADVTRTYAADTDTPFAALVAGLEALQQSLIRSIRPGTDFVSLHEDAHRLLAELLADSDLIRCSPEAALAAGVTDAFLPHGLGHLIGLQTHDVGGWLSSPEGDSRPPPERFPALRLTRKLEDAMPVTMEPGIYFIAQLLDGLRTGPADRLVNWSTVEALLPFGGIRIEDNVVLSGGTVENLTRQAFAELERE